MDYTSEVRHSQIYIGFVNWFLLIAVLYIMKEFRESNSLAAAYGFAVTGTMLLTGIFMTGIFYLRKKFAHSALSFLVTLVTLVFFLSNIYKIPHGGYWSIIIAAIPFSVIMLYRAGQRKLYYAVQPLPRDVFLLSYNQIYRSINKIKGTALFFARDAKEMPPYIVHTIFKNNILHEHNIIVSIVKRDDPFGATGFYTGELAPGLRSFEIQTGYMEVPDVEEILREAGIQEKTIFYGVEDILPTNIVWHIFAIIKKLTPQPCPVLQTSLQQTAWGHYTSGIVTRRPIFSRTHSERLLLRLFCRNPKTIMSQFAKIEMSRCSSPPQGAELSEPGFCNCIEGRDPDGFFILFSGLVKARQIGVDVSLCDVEPYLVRARLYQVCQNNEH